MIFSLLVQAPPSSQSSRSAYKFAQAVLKQEHQLYRVFFYYDGVYSASDQAVVPQDEPDLTDDWATLGQAYNLDLVVCIAASLKRGLLDEQEALRYEKTAIAIKPPFVLSGLGQLVDAAVHADRLITFG